MPKRALHRQILLKEVIPTAAALTQVTERPSTQSVFLAFLNNYVEESNHIYKSKWVGKHALLLLVLSSILSTKGRGKTTLCVEISPAELPSRHCLHITSSAIFWALTPSLNLSMPLQRI